jgi:hypothetical protein
MALNLRRLVVACAFTLLGISFSAVHAFSTPLWVYDGTTNAQVWFSGVTTPTSDSNTYGPGAGSADATVSFCDAQAQSGGTSGSAATIGSGLPGYQLTAGTARANLTLEGLSQGNYTISFDYATSPAVQTTLLTGNGEVGFEVGTSTQELTGSGFYSTVVTPVDSVAGYWISFYALTQVTAVDGSTTANASISNITVTPASSLPTPLPGALWLLGPGLVSLAAMRRRFKK